MIPDAAIEAAWELSLRQLGLWGKKLPEGVAEARRDNVRSLLEAAAPHIVAPLIEALRVERQKVELLLELQRTPEESARRTEAAVIWHDPIVSIRTGDAVVDAIYNMERASRDYTLPQHFTLNGDGTITRG